MKPMHAAIEKAMRELPGTTLGEIQMQTAYTWAGRACAAATLGLHTDAIEYAHEAIEHAALSGNDPLLAEIRKAFVKHNIELTVP